MKPCECLQGADLPKLHEQGIRINNYSMWLVPRRVHIKNEAGVEVWLPMKVFETFAEWYLEDQKKGVEK